MKSTKPPRILLRFLKWFCKPSYHIDIEGDLLECHERNVQKFGKRKADLRLAKDVLMLFRPSMMKSPGKLPGFIQRSLLSNYVKVSWRNILRQKLYSLFNVAGLVIGITCFILTSVFIAHERSFDAFYDNVDNIYHVYEYEYSSGDSYLGTDYYAVTPAQLATTMMADYPEVGHATTIAEEKALLTASSGDRWLEKGLYTDPTFFKLFSHPLFLEGDPQSVFEQPRSLVLTASLASKIFPDGEALGKTLNHENKPHVITGIVQDPPNNSTFQFTFMANLQDDQRYLNEFKKERWDGSNYYTFFSLNPAADPMLLQQKMADLIDRYWVKDLNFKFDYLVQPIREVHFNGRINNGFSIHGSQQQIQLFGWVAVLILMLAGINYVNLFIARSMGRIKEVGVRKSFGAGKKQVLFQFLLESEMLTLFAFCISLFIAHSLLPFFGELLGRTLALSIWNDLNLLLTLAGLVLVLGLLTGLYPALVISSPSTIKLIQGKLRDGIRGKGIRKSLIVFQYAVSIAMAICTLVMFQQFKFIGEKELGFEQDQILAMEVLDREIIKNYEVIKAEWLTNPDVISVGTSQNLPHDIQSSTVVNDDKGGDPNDDLEIYRLRADRDFLDLFGLELVAGSSLPQSRPKKQQGKGPDCLINETAAKAMGWSPHEAIGKVLTDDSPHNHRRVIGVVRDIHMHRMHLKISPLLIETKPFFEYISVKVHGKDIPELMRFLDKSLRKYSQYPVAFRFMDDRIQQLYEAEQKRATLFSVLSLLAILIASLGLYSLAALDAHQKVKEVGIRKVLGASIFRILVLTSGSFLRLIIWGLLVAIPLAWWSMNTWLENYAYRIELDGIPFLVIGTASLLIAVLTVGGQSLKAALVNPVDCLRDE